jgi:hypothetical protein
MQRLRYCWTITVETVFSLCFMPKCYKQGQSSSRVINCQQFSWVKWHEVAGWWVREFSCHLKDSLWREDKEVGVKWPPAWDPLSWVVSSVDRSSAQAAVTTWAWEAEESLSVEAVARKRRVETNRLWTLICICQWSVKFVKCSSEWCIQVVNKSNIQSIPHL